jgi:formate hydrogenlyase subunit 3/multisubunit Na+/H+ antiporter MnhD subunit
MYLTSYSRAAIDALLYFLIWAIIGSILVAYGFFLLINLTNTTNFSELLWMNFSSEEVYYIYLLFFFGFGVKLSI